MTDGPQSISTEMSIAPDDLAARIELYLDDAPMYGGHSDRAGGTCWELLREAMEDLRHLAQSSRTWDQGEHEGCGIDSQRAMARDQVRGDLTKIAAECHRAKWEFDVNGEERPPTKTALLELTSKAFNALHRIGDLALKLRDASPQPASNADSSANCDVLRDLPDYLDYLEQSLIDLDVDLKLPKNMLPPGIWAERIRALSIPSTHRDGDAQ